jgi:hypothetical protein
MTPATDRPPLIVGVRELAGILGVSPDWVYAHADRLGAIRLGPRAPLRFDPADAIERLRASMGYGTMA